VIETVEQITTFTQTNLIGQIKQTFATSDIYQQRFNERYFGEGNFLLTKIQTLLADKE
jgi:hypothetical protein